jgi:hypothetical protein
MSVEGKLIFGGELTLRTRKNGPKVLRAETCRLLTGDQILSFFAPSAATTEFEWFTVYLPH